MDNIIDTRIAGPAPEEPVPLVRQTLSEQIYERLKADIISHRINFGEKLVNRELQQKFGTSSTPIRDAINHLYLDGLLDEITRSGARVISFDLKFALDVNEIVMILNKGAINSIARTGRLEELANSLEPLVAAQSAVQSTNDYILLDRQFHQTFFNCCGNSHLSQVYSHYTVLFEMMVRLSVVEPAQRQSRLEQHRNLYNLCRARDAAALLQEMEHHYLDAARWFSTHSAIFDT